MAPGKTAPRLLQDLLTYDPRYEERAGRNLLTTAPPEHGPNSPAVPAVPYRNCRHALVRKDEQCQLPVPGDDPTPTTLYKVASYCPQCSWHFDVFVDFRHTDARDAPCRKTSREYPLHHFLFTGTDNASSSSGLAGTLAPQTHNFRCTAPRCPVTVRISLKPPRFSDQDKQVLTNQAQLRRRWELTKELADRADTTMARPVDAPDFLNTYLQDSLNPVKGKARIPLLNRKFLKTFGRDCDSILRSLGFESAVETDEDGTQVEIWNLPKPEEGDLFQPTLRNKIEDARYELNTMILAIPESERTGARHKPMYPTPSQGDIERALACHDYDKVPGRAAARSTNHEEDHPYYASLGAIGDFSDSLILFAYKRQSAMDEVNVPYYLECLQDLAVGRDSIMLQTEVATLNSQGRPNRRDRDAAYRFLAIDPSHSHALSDDVIISTYRVRLPDISPSQREEARRQLRIIGESRDSFAIIQEAADTIDTYEQALSWLGLEHGQADDFVRTMYTIKVQDDPSCQEIAQKAVLVIADHRDSDRLRQFLQQGTMSEPEMGLDEAYALFSISAISDRKAVDLSVLESTVVVDSSGDVEKLRKAYKLIEQDQRQNYNNAAEKPREPGARINDIPLDTWPVGCRNIGNTCYLNSVLQFLFTIKPLRDLILKYEDHLQDPSAAALEGKKVGRTIVTAERVATAQRFVRELRDLFKWMIEASTDNVQPTIDLAALALCKTDSPEVDQKAPEAEISGTNGLGAIDGMPVNGPMAAPTANENLIFTPADSVMGDDNDDAKSDTSMQAMNGDESKGTEPDADDKPVPPTRPPPIPPRPDTQTKTKLEHIGDSARQQDAAEVLGNIMDLLSCAIRGNEDVLRDGEQNDLIKSLFFSDVTIVRNTAKGAENTSELRNHYLISAGGRDRHLYAALDDDFGLNELEGGETKYEYVAKAAPIQIINVRRLQFDKEKKRQVRDQAQLGLDDTLYLDRYLESTDSLSGEQLLRLRKAQWDRQQELHRLEGRRKELQTPELEGMDLADSVEETAMLTQNFLAEIEQQMNSSLPTPPAELPGVLHDKAKQLKEELTNINDSMTQLESEIDSVFKDCRDHSYRLHSIFIHRGGTQAGHYLIYIYDFQNKMWREYNDETVKQADRSDIFKLGAGSLASGSTGIVYIREDLVDTLTEAVQRQPEMTSVSTSVPTDAPTGAPTRSPTGTADIEMKDFEASTPLQPIDYDNIEVIDGVEKPGAIQPNGYTAEHQPGPDEEVIDTVEVEMMSSPGGLEPRDKRQISKLESPPKRRML